jgi:hypothetical protein
MSTASVATQLKLFARVEYVHGRAVEPLTTNRWATLGAFYPFYRNPNGDSSIPQEFYLWETVTEAAKSAIDICYHLLDHNLHYYAQTISGWNTSLEPNVLYIP